MKFDWTPFPWFNHCPECQFNANIELKKHEFGARYICLCCGISGSLHCKKVKKTMKDTVFNIKFELPCHKESDNED